MKNEQLSFFESIEELEKLEKYDATICIRCCCNKCKYSVEIYPFIDDKECKEVGDNACFNCDECYYYGMDDGSLSMNIVKLECDKFEMSNHYKKLEVEKRRKSFKII